MNHRIPVPHPKSIEMPTFKINLSDWMTIATGSGVLYYCPDQLNRFLGASACYYGYRLLSKLVSRFSQSFRSNSLWQIAGTCVLYHVSGQFHEISLALWKHSGALYHLTGTLSASIYIGSYISLLFGLTSLYLGHCLQLSVAPYLNAATTAFNRVRLELGQIQLDEPTLARIRDIVQSIGDNGASVRRDMTQFEERAPLRCRGSENDTLGDKVAECAVCLEEFTGKSLYRQLPCNGAHLFHAGCIDGWFMTHNTCPMCREEI